MNPHSTPFYGGSVTTASAQETRRIAFLLASMVKGGDVFGLCGPLGAGKTEFVRGFVEALGSRDTVRSPSFSILAVYTAPCFPIFHWDFYRMCQPNELYETGFDEYCLSDGVTMVEWADKFPASLPPYTVWITFQDKGNERRVLSLSSTEEMPARINIQNLSGAVAVGD